MGATPSYAPTPSDFASERHLYLVPPLPIRTVTDLPLRTDPHQTALVSLMTLDSIGEEHIMRTLLNL